jgi:hypothetical protein
VSKLEIIPFGKYKGQPVDLLAQDPQYCEWLSQQDWFRTRYPAIHTLIINHFGQPEETPEHNALQALFVDEGFRRRFVLHVLGGQERIYDSVLKARNSTIARLQNKIEEYTKDEFYKDRIPKLEDKIPRLERALPEIEISAEFEVDGMDVVIKYSPTIKGLEQDLWDEIHATVQLSSPFWEREIYVECKPSVGDDYPAILRQISAAVPKHFKSILFIGQNGYVGSGATFEQVKAIFKSRKIDIILQEELR